MNNVVQKTVRELNELQYHIMHISMVEMFMPHPLTPRQKEVLAHFMCLEKRRDVMFLTKNRKTVLKLLGNKSQAYLSNLLGELEEKKYLVKENGTYIINPVLVPHHSGKQVYQFKFEAKEHVGWDI